MKTTNDCPKHKAVSAINSVLINILSRDENNILSRENDLLFRKNEISFSKNDGISKLKFYYS